MAYLVFIRHGRSEWNEKGLWTGWTDVSLSGTGKEEAKKAADAIRDIVPRHCFTSKLKRAQETLDIILHELHLSDIPVTESEALNERNYGIYTGKNKWEVKKQLGEETFLKLRRSWDYPIQDGESLKDVNERAYPYFRSHILPLLQQQENVLIVAHGNSIRAIIKSLEDVPDDEAQNISIGTGEAHIYELDENGSILKKEVRATNTAKV